MTRIFDEMIRKKSHIGNTFASSKPKFMPSVKYHHAAMEYAMSYQEHLLRMESVLGKKIEAKMEEIIDRKFDEYMERKKNRNIEQ